MHQQVDTIEQYSDLCEDYSLSLSSVSTELEQVRLNDYYQIQDLTESNTALSLQCQTQEAELSALRLNEARNRASLGLMTEPAYVLSREDIELLAKVVQCEAGHSVNLRGEPINTAAQKYITKVVLNRVVSPTFPDNVYDVVYQKNQFSVIDQLDDVEIEVGTLLNIYDVLLHNGADDLPVYVCYFYADWVKDQWINTLPVYMTCDGTVYAYDVREVSKS